MRFFKIGLPFLLTSFLVSCTQPPPEIQKEQSLQKEFEKQKAASALEDLGLAEMAKENYAKAIEYFTKALKLDPENPKLWKELGEAYAAAKFYGEAEKDFLKALSLKPDYGEAMFDLGLLYFHWKKYDKALKWLKKAAYLPTYGDRYKAFYQLAKLYKKLGNLRLYLQNLQYAVNLYPLYDKPLLELARYYASVGDLENARIYYTKYIASHPNDVKVAVEYVRFLLNKGRYGEARKLLAWLRDEVVNPEDVSEVQNLINELILKEAEQKLKALKQKETKTSPKSLRQKGETPPKVEVSEAPHAAVGKSKNETFGVSAKGSLQYKTGSTTPPKVKNSTVSR